jgi:hypothetical protein
MTTLKYLENDICDFKIVHGEIDYSKKINIICAVFFKMNKYYKDFSSYIEGLKFIVNYVDNVNTDYKFRIFVDNNVYKDENIMKVLTKSSNVTVLLFKCPNYMTDDFHVGLFGTLVRFFPFFKFKNNDAARVIMVDIDDFPNYMRGLNGMLDYKHQGICGNGVLIEALVMDQLPYISASHLSSYDKYDPDLIIDFIVNNDKYSDAYKKNVYNRSVKKADFLKGQFNFGVDEIFLNFVMIEKGKMEVSIWTCYETMYFPYNQFNIPPGAKSRRSGFKLEFLNRLDFRLEKHYRKMHYNIIKMMIGKYYKKTMNTKMIMEEIDNQFYKKDKPNEKAIYYGKKFYKTIKYLKKTKKKWLDMNVINFIDKYMQNVFSTYLITIFNDKGKVKDVVMINPVMLE